MIQATLSAYTHTKPSLLDSQLALLYRGAANQTRAIYEKWTDFPLAHKFPVFRIGPNNVTVFDWQRSSVQGSAISPRSHVSQHGMVVVAASRNCWFDLFLLLRLCSRVSPDRKKGTPRRRLNFVYRALRRRAQLALYCVSIATLCALLPTTSCAPSSANKTIWANYFVSKSGPEMRWIGKGSTNDETRAGSDWVS